MFFFSYFLIFLTPHHFYFYQETIRTLMNQWRQRKCNRLFTDQRFLLFSEALCTIVSQPRQVTSTRHYIYHITVIWQSSKVYQGRQSNHLPCRSQKHHALLVTTPVRPSFVTLLTLFSNRCSLEEMLFNHPCLTTVPFSSVKSLNVRELQ